MVNPQLYPEVGWPFIISTRSAWALRRSWPLQNSHVGEDPSFNIHSNQGRPSTTSTCTAWPARRTWGAWRWEPHLARRCRWWSGPSAWARRRPRSVCTCTSPCCRTCAAPQPAAYGVDDFAKAHSRVRLDVRFLKLPEETGPAESSALNC